MIVGEKMYVLICHETEEVHDFHFAFYGDDGREEAEWYAKKTADQASCGPHQVGEVWIRDIRPVNK